jgi:hypothetical protein
MADYSGGQFPMIRFQTLNTGGLFEKFVKDSIQKSAVTTRTNARMVNAIIRESGILPRFDIGLVGEVIRQNGVIGRFDNVFMKETLQGTKFFSRIERVVTNRMIEEKQLLMMFYIYYYRSDILYRKFYEGEVYGSRSVKMSILRK